MGSLKKTNNHYPSQFLSRRRLYFSFSQVTTPGSNLTTLFVTVLAPGCKNFIVPLRDSAFTLLRRHLPSLDMTATPPLVTRSAHSATTAMSLLRTAVVTVVENVY
ncbi:UNVERIFIED_CONTAM: hypothetical protein Sradi_0357600 [Sesamum radiatum]|uniref:Uncharacterized protein n=1 Tax=Sesamum radiatum TaxID=300843 RepID=A0AAW2W3R4_SESRA